MTMPDVTHAIALPGLDGANPLGFLSAIGTLAVYCNIGSNIRLSWSNGPIGWRPVLSGCGNDKELFLDLLHQALVNASMKAFSVDNKLPFSANIFRKALVNVRSTASLTNRREVDFLAAFGSEVFIEKNGSFQETCFRMVRSGDSAGQGLPVYARSIRAAIQREHLKRTLMMPWDYRDNGFSLRWDPLEDRRYALHWRDPSKSNINDSLGTMLAANTLATEALRLYPTQPTQKQTQTTGFHRFHNRATYFTWPIWTAPLGLDVIRSLLALSELTRKSPRHDVLETLGVEAVFRSQRIQPNKYYSNFAPAQPA